LIVIIHFVFKVIFYQKLFNVSLLFIMLIIMYNKFIFFTFLKYLCIILFVLFCGWIKSNRIINLTNFIIPLLILSNFIMILIYFEISFKWAASWRRIRWWWCQFSLTILLFLFFYFLLYFIDFRLLNVALLLNIVVFCLL